MTNRYDRHDWLSPEYVQEWITRARADDSRRASRFQLIADLIPFPKDAAIRLMDIGAGYGPVSGFMLEAFPNSRIVAHDYSDEMLHHARTILAVFGDRVSFHRADLFSEDWADGCDGPFDAIVSSIAIHNLQSAPRIRQLYTEICALLNDGGCFLNIDLVSAPTPDIQRIYWKMMARERRSAAQDQAASPPAASPQPSSIDNDDWPPFPASMQEQLTWLREAGFRQVDCFWKEMSMALVGGFK